MLNRNISFKKLKLVNQLIEINDSTIDILVVRDENGAGECMLCGRKCKPKHPIHHRGNCIVNDFKKMKTKLTDMKAKLADK